ncbi:MAG: ABC transporter permease [Acidobacteriota bacterium]
MNDLRFALRQLLKKPGFAAIAALTLALGIGANTAIFSLVYSTLLRPLPYRDADRMLVFNISVPDYRDIRASNQSFDEMALWASNLYNLSDGAETEQTLGAVVSPSFFAMLGPAMVGRVFTTEEDNQPLAVISHDLWQRRFGGSSETLGRAIRLSGQSYTIVGVMPPEFEFPSNQFKLWVPFGLAASAAPQQMENRQLRIFRALARLKSGVSIEQAQSEMKAIGERLQADHPETNAGVEIRATPLYERIVGDIRLSLLVLLGAVGLVLLISCANVANLLLARATTRAREVAIRSALGATRSRITRQFLTESLLLALAGAALGVLFAWWGIDALRALDPNDIPRIRTAGINLSVLLFTLAVSLLTGVVFGLAPALQASKTNLTDALKEGSRALAGGRGRLRSALVAAEIALSLVVLVGAGLLIQSFARLLNVERGFVTENLITANLVLVQYKDGQRRAAVLNETLDRIRRIPGVEFAGGGSALPPVTAQRATRFEIEGRTLESGDNGAYFIATSSDYFRAMGTPLLAGRFFDERDTEKAPNVVLINQSLARRLFPDEDPLGKHLKLVNPEQSSEWRTIVGVIADVRYSGLDDPGEAAIYTPFNQTPFLWSYLMVRTTDANIAASLRAAVTSVDSSLELAAITPMRQLVSESVARPEFNMLLLSAFAILALVLASVGIYGVMSYWVEQQTREIGIRSALGATSGNVIAMILGHAIRIILAGIAAGLAAAFALTRMMQSLLFEVSATDATTFITVSLLLTGVALGACAVPARRATRVDPIVALRYE